MFSTKNKNENLTKKEKIELLFEKHQPVLEKLGVPNPLFIPKMIFGSPPVFYLFQGELKYEKDIYIEKVSKNYDSEDPERTLYKWKYNPHYSDYDTKQISSSTEHCYIIPFSELIPIVNNDEADEFDIPNPTEDLPISELTIRDLAAILTQKPVSLKPWLNKIIKS